MKWELLKKFYNQLDYSPSEKFVLAHSSAMNPCDSSVPVLKGVQACQEKHHVRPVAIFVRRNLNSFNIVTTSKFVDTLHIYAKLRMAICDKVNIKVSSTY